MAGEMLLPGVTGGGAMGPGRSEHPGPRTLSSMISMELLV